MDFGACFWTMKPIHVIKYRARYCISVHSNKKRQRALLKMDTEQKQAEQNIIPCCGCCDRISHPKCRFDKEKRRIEPLSSWITLMAVIFINILVSVPETSFGIFYDYLQDKFDSSTAAIGWIIFVYIVISSLTGLAVSPFIVYYGCRPVSVISVTIMALGMSLCSVAQNLASFVVVFGLIGGIGFGGLLLTSTGIVQQCFSYNRGLATGIASLGYTAGTILTPVLVDLFLTRHTLEGALLLHGSLFVQGIVFAMLLKSPDKYIQRKLRIRANRTVSRSGNPEENKLKQIEENENVRSDSDCVHALGGSINSTGVEVQNESETEIDDLVSKDSTEQKPCAQQTGIKFLFKNIFDFSILKERPFLLLVFHMFCLIVSRVGLLSHTVSAAILQGVPPGDAAYLFTIMGFVNLITRIASSLILNLRGVNPVVHTCIGTTLLSASGVIAAFASTYEMFVVCMVFLGGYEGITNTVYPMVIVHVIGVERFARSYSIMRVCNLPAPLIGAPFAGWLMDITGGYTVSFLLLAFTGALSTFFAIAIVVLLRGQNNVTEGQEIPDTDTVNQEQGNN